MQNKDSEICDDETELISRPCYNIVLAITVGKVLTLACIIWAGYASHFNPLIIPSISEIIELNIYLKALYISAVIISQMALVLLYWQIEDETFNYHNSMKIYLIVVLSILQCLGFVFVGIFDVSVHPVAHYTVTGGTFILTFLRQIIFYFLDYSTDTSRVQSERPCISCNPEGTGFCLCLNIRSCSSSQRLQAMIILNVLHVACIIGLLVPYSIVVLTFDPPHTTIALCEHLAVYFTSILHFYNVVLLSFARRS